jgi:hypothetical protein
MFREIPVYEYSFAFELSVKTNSNVNTSIPEKYLQTKINRQRDGRLFSGKGLKRLNDSMTVNE